MTTVFRALFACLAAIGLFASGPAAQAQDKTIKIGALFPMSGPGSYFGAQDKQGVELALEQLNKTGVNGYKFVVQYEDSSCSPLPATQAAGLRGPCPAAQQALGVQPVQQRAEVRDVLHRLATVELQRVGEPHEELVLAGRLSVDRLRHGHDVTSIQPLTSYIMQTTMSE